MKKGVILLALVLLPAAAQAEAMGAFLAQINLLWSSFRIGTKQQASSSDKVDRVKVQSAQAGSSALIDLYNREQVRKVWNDYGPSGQLVDPCYQVGMADTSATIKNRTDDSVIKIASMVYETADNGEVQAPGAAGLFGGRAQRTAVPFAATVGKRVERHQQKYCSVSEAAQGYCTLSPNGMQSGDSDFSLHVTGGRTFGWDQTEAAADFVKTIAPVKPMPVRSGCTSVECKVEMQARREQEASMAMARYSLLRFMEARTTQAVGEAKQAPGGK